MDDRPPSTEKFRSPFGLLLWTNGLQMWRRLRDSVTQSSALTGIIIILLVFYPLISAGMFWGGLKYLSKFPGLGNLLIERLVFLLFAILFMLLLFSNVVVGYTNMFRNDESRFLRSLPFEPNTVFQWKLIETTFVASWAFLVLVAPLLLAYGVFQSGQPGHIVGWQYYLCTPILIILFIILPGIAGCWAAVFMARYLDRSLFQATAVLILLAIVYLLTAYLQPEAASEQTLEVRVVDLTDRMLSKTQFAHFPFLPSYWLSNSITSWVEGLKSTAGFFVLVLLSNVLFFGFLGFTQTGKYFHQSLSATLSRGSLAGDWSRAVRFGPRLCAQVILIAWLMPYVDFSGMKAAWHEKFTPLNEEYSDMKEAQDISAPDLGRWLTNKVSLLEPEIARGQLYALKPELRQLYWRSFSGEMALLGPDLEHLINANLRSSLTGLDLVRGRSVLRGPAAEFAAEQKATLMPDGPTNHVAFLHRVTRPSATIETVTFTGHANLQTNTTHRLYLRRHVDRVDTELKPTGQKRWVTDHGEYLEGTLVRTGEQFQLQLKEEQVSGFQLRKTFPQLPNDDNTSWILGRVAPPLESHAPPDRAGGGLPPLAMLAVPLLAALAWILNSRAAHLICAVGVLGLFIAFATQSGDLITGLDEGTLASGVGNLSYIGLGAWLTIIFALGQAALSLWQAPLAKRWETWYRERQERERNKEFEYAPGLAERLLRCIPFIKPDVMAVMLKDMRVFWRDTAQWGQSLILFGILGVYILYLPFFTEQFAALGGRFGGGYFEKLVSFMNLAACALNLTTLTTRFVYPQFSLEGRRLWIVGMAPLGLAHVVAVKFRLALGISLLISVPLIWLSSKRLGLPTDQTLFLCGAIAIMCIALNGLAVGMGVIYPNLREENPSKIVSGFGGTFCLVISFIYIGAMLILLSIGSPYGSPWQIWRTSSLEQQATFLSLFAVTSLATGLGPLWYALRKARRFEH